MLPHSAFVTRVGVVTKVATRGADLQKSESKQAQVESENEERSKT